ncbi:MAG: hypothetical protein KY468_17550, partial [Armatimonadetes bacterium]|nr:hypothetical protein [Armatimonadota bacterium]
DLEARFIIAVPCCQSELLNQMKAHPLSAMTRHGVYAARFADLLTDGLRTLALEAAGYEVSVAEFVPTEDTPKNLMIRAERVRGRTPAALQRYWDLAAPYGVDPAIQRYLPWLKPRRSGSAKDPARSPAPSPAAGREHPSRRKRPR